MKFTHPTLPIALSLTFAAAFASAHLWENTPVLADEAKESKTNPTAIVKGETRSKTTTRPNEADARRDKKTIEFPEYKILRIPFKPGEKLTYEFGWEGIPAASGTASVATAKIGGRELFRFHTFAATNPIIDLLWKMRDSGDSWVDMETLVPQKYVIRQRENERDRKTVMLYNYDDKVAHSVEHKRDTGTIRRRKINFQRPYDPISIAYLLRSLAYKVGDDKKIELLDGRHTYLFTVKTLKKEKITIRAGKFNAIKIQPRIVELGGDNDIEKKLKNAYIWVSDDEKRLPLKITSAVFIGRVYAELVEYKLSQEDKAKGESKGGKGRSQGKRKNDRN